MSMNVNATSGYQVWQWCDMQYIFIFSFASLHFMLILQLAYFLIPSKRRWCPTLALFTCEVCCAVVAVGRAAARKITSTNNKLILQTIGQHFSFRCLGGANLTTNGKLQVPCIWPLQLRSVQVTSSWLDDGITGRLDLVSESDLILSTSADISARHLDPQPCLII